MWNATQVDLPPDGLVVFTVHGRRAEQHMRSGVMYDLDEPSMAALLAQYERDEFGYCDYPGKTGYGVSLCTPGWVASEIVGSCAFRLLSFTEMGWDRHQDVVVCGRL